MRVVIDTNIFIEYLRRQAGPLRSLLSPSQEYRVHTLIVPSVVVYELWSGKSMIDTKNQLLIEQLLSDFTVVDFSGTIAKKAGELRRAGFVDGVDAMVASTTLLTADSLCTLNTKHFQNIPGIRLWNP